MGPGPQPASDISFCKHPYGHMDLFSCNLNDVWSSQDGKSWVQLRSPRIWDPRHAMVSCPPDLHTKHPRFLFVWANPASTPGLACACAWLCCAFASWNRERAAAQRNGRRVSLVCPAGATFSVPCLASGVVRAGRLALGGCGQQLESHNAPLAGHGQRAVAGQPFHGEILMRSRALPNSPPIRRRAGRVSNVLELAMCWSNREGSKQQLALTRARNPLGLGNPADKELNLKFSVNLVYFLSV